MTHAESQDLLLDLAYGELDAQRAAEVASHVEGCAECRKEKAALEETRRMAAPLRELEEPSPGFDDRILAAARAQAQLEHDGNVGQVIEVTGSVRPLGLEAARIDAHGPVKARATRRDRPRWIVRAALGGSVAAAAALVLVVSNTLETRRNAEKANALRSDEYAIRVQTAADSLDSALRDAEAKRDKDRVETMKLEAAPPAPAAALEKEKIAQLSAPAHKPAKKAGTSGVRIEGGGGDAAGKTASKNTPAPPRESDAARTAARASTASPSAGATKSAPPAAGSIRMQTARERDVSADMSEPVRDTPQGAVAAAPGPVVGAAPAPAAPAEARQLNSAAPAPAPSVVEANAQQARHAGNYALAASLYRNAAELRQRDNDAGGAAWDLAHAVECLSAVGQFDEARRLRDELARLYPSETTALSAARRALREVDLPAAAPVQKNP
ncbi:MAG TPA: zf-HC2 domain-containing protein [Myxococcales bacterium]